MDLSIIIPVYNREQTIEKCIDSLKHQIDDSCEIIMVDDGSSDNTISLCQKYLCDNISIIMQAHGGVSAARNNGIANAKGRYVAFVDSDDYVGDDYISIIKAAIKDEPELVIFSSFELQTSNGNFTKKAIDLSPCESCSPVAAYNALIEQKLNNVVLKLFRTDLIRANQILFNTNMIVSEDYLFVMDYLSICSKIKISTYLPYYYVYNTSGTYKIRTEHLQNLINAYKSTSLFIEKSCPDINKDNMQIRFLQQAVEFSGKLYEKKLMSKELEEEFITSSLYSGLCNYSYSKPKSKIEKAILVKKSWRLATRYFYLVKILEKIKNYVGK